MSWNNIIPSHLSVFELGRRLAACETKLALAEQKYDLQCASHDYWVRQASRLARTEKALERCKEQRDEWITAFHNIETGMLPDEKFGWVSRAIEDDNAGLEKILNEK